MSKPLSVLLLVYLLGAVEPVQAEVDWEQVGELLARPVSGQATDIHRFSFPRSDLAVTLDGLAIRPGLALGS